jgi:hypothetical protein
MTAKRCSPCALLAGVILIGGAILTWGRCSRERLVNETSPESDRRATQADFDRESSVLDSVSSKQPREQEPEVARRVREKLNSIIIPVVDLDDTSFEEAIDFLRVRTAELDPDSDPSLNDAIKFPEGMIADGIGTRRIQNFSERNISMWKVLKRIASDCRVKIKPTDQGFEFIPISPAPAEAK